MSDLMSWTLPAGNIQSKLTAVALVYGCGIMVWAQWLPLRSRGLLFFSTVPGLLVLLIWRLSRCWVAGKRLHIRNGGRAVVAVEVGEIESIEWRAAHGLGVGQVSVVCMDGSQHRMWSTTGTNRSWAYVKKDLQSILAQAG